MIPLDEWPIVAPEEVPKVSARQKAREDAANAAWTAREVEVRTYFEAVAEATKDLKSDDEVNEYCFRLEEWNAAVNSD